MYLHYTSPPPLRDTGPLNTEQPVSYSIATSSIAVLAYYQWSSIPVLAEAGVRYTLATTPATTTSTLEWQ